MNKEKFVWHGLINYGLYVVHYISAKVLIMDSMNHEHNRVGEHGAAIQC